MMATEMWVSWGGMELYQQVIVLEIIKRGLYLESQSQLVIPGSLFSKNYSELSSNFPFSSVPKLSSPSFLSKNLWFTLILTHSYTFLSPLHNSPPHKIHYLNYCAQPKWEKKQGFEGVMLEGR
ncbi:unnamed protein product [Cuscuta europaea]|uniref:Uncharacterized protein n=1 Tax=Cuscuta europaea TaxID=41803 RepID=A0A9P0ZRA2_CUSEU|nr:unnamed protein product [Cuscuta europaea]